MTYKDILSRMADAFKGQKITAIEASDWLSTRYKHGPGKNSIGYCLGKHPRFRKGGFRTVKKYYGNVKVREYYVI